MADDEMLDAYADENMFSTPGGENVLSFNDDGSASVEKKARDERPNTFKDSKKIASCSDDAIRFISERPSGIRDYVVLGASVSWRGLGNGKAREFLCLGVGHVVNDCPHIRRLRRWCADYPDHAVPKTPQLTE